MNKGSGICRVWLIGMAVLIAASGCTERASDGGTEPAVALDGINQGAEDVSSEGPNRTGQTLGAVPVESDNVVLPGEQSELVPPGVPEEQAGVPGEQDGTGELVPQSMLPDSTGGAATPYRIEGSEAPEPNVATLTELRADLSPQQLLEFLSAADGDMQLIASGRSGIEDPKEARRTLLHIVRMKLDASRRLAGNAELDDRARAEGARGELQSLSHLASLGNLKAAEELEALAQERLESDDPQLVADSRLVLIGFAIESLQNGDQEAPARLIRYIDQIAAASDSPDVAAMMVMGQARESLTRYGHEQEARQVRDRIIELFADSAEPQIAEMAARFAGTVRFDAIDKLLKEAINGQSVDPAEWKMAVATLIDESADLQTVQYLSGASLELEGCGQNDLAMATYEVMTDRFREPDAATTQEVTMANEAYQARKRVIGRVFDPELDSVDGADLSLSEYRGKVVLVPFWAMNFPQSLQVLPQLREIAGQNPEQVVMIGVNMDAEGAAVGEFEKSSKLGFRSFRSINESTSQIVTQFGIVSMPFTAILGTDGKVVELDFTGKKLQAAIDRLLHP